VLRVFDCLPEDSTLGGEVMRWNPDSGHEASPDNICSR
jgi:hypothetical protein